MNDSNFKNYGRHTCGGGGEVGFEEVKIFLKFPLTFWVRSANLSAHTEKIITK